MLLIIYAQNLFTNTTEVRVVLLSLPILFVPILCEEPHRSPYSLNQQRHGINAVSNKLQTEYGVRQSSQSCLFPTKLQGFFLLFSLLLEID